MADNTPASIQPGASSVTIPDMTASLNAKVVVSDDQQADPAQLAACYDAMAAKFLQHGLNIEAVQATRQYFDLSQGTLPRPLEYARFPSPLPEAAVRLGVLFMQKCNPTLASLAHQAALDIARHIPPGYLLHLNEPSHYHVTVFMTSQPHTLRPDPFDPGWAPPSGDAPPAGWAAPAPAALARELRAMAAAAAAEPPPRLRAQRLLLADSGTLLLCSVDVSGGLAALRRRLRRAFPGAPPRQSTIVHCSLGRVLGGEEMGADAAARIAAACDAWTMRLAGAEWTAPGLTHVRETVFTTVEGPAVFMPFASEP
ncbi:hypothetical protein ACKKBG_A04890 [Auxenochlorella protothecoides x Auxenochlorella symbiontica]